MECLKCGKVSKNDQVFCAECLKKMEDYPVKPDVPVVLPSRKNRQSTKKSGRKRRITTPEEQVVLLKRRQRRLIWTVVVLALALVLAGLLLAQQWIGNLQNGDAHPTETTYHTQG
ncbi:MAG: hypothetical protein IKK11_07935 [Oscillospiraceae bacterium]|nr:hypothetical protein [Oscillospiraceae bacterium]